MNPDQVFTTGEVAKYCHVAFRTVIRWIDSGLLKAYQLPGRGDNRVRLVDLLNFMRNHKLPLIGDIQPYSQRVLIVDDDASMLKAIQRVLVRAGYETLTTSDGFSAGTAMFSFLPALMTLDLQMPKVDGFAVLESLRSGQLPVVKVLVISALSEEMINRAMEVGADAALNKPFENDALLLRVRQLIGSPAGI